MGTQTAPLFFYHPFCLIKLAFYIVWVIWIVCRVSAVYMVYVFGNLDNLHGFGGLSGLVVFGNVGNLYGLGSLGTAGGDRSGSARTFGTASWPGQTPLGLESGRCFLFLFEYDFGLF